MNEEKICVDASRPATLNNGGSLDDCPSLQGSGGMGPTAARAEKTRNHQGHRWPAFHSCRN